MVHNVVNDYEDLKASAKPIKHDAIENATGITIPLYVDPGTGSALSTEWQQVYDQKILHPKCRIVAIANPDNGPGSSQAADYVFSIGKFRDIGIEVIGYIATGYNGLTDPSPPAVSDAEFKSLVDDWVTFYGDAALGKGRGISGIFMDEMSNVDDTGDEGDNVTWYTSLTAYCKDTYSELVWVEGNPGAPQIEEFVDACDLHHIYESAGLPTLASIFAGWMQNYDKQKFAIIPFDSGTATDAYIKDCRNYCGMAYLQDDDLPNPWDTVSVNFDRMVEIFSGDFVKDTASLRLDSALGGETSSPVTESGGIENINTWRGWEAVQLGAAGEYYLITHLEYEIDTVDGGDQVLGLFRVDAEDPTATDPKLLAYTEAHSGGATQTAFKLPLWEPGRIIVEGDEWLMAMINSDNAVNATFAAQATLPSQNTLFTETYSATPSFAARSITWSASDVHMSIKIFYRRL